MQRFNFTAFYPSRPFWAGTKVNFEIPKVGDWLYDQMAEEVYMLDTDAFALRICRDGRILLRVAALESPHDEQQMPPIEDTVRRWGTYLNFLNAFYLLLDSASVEG